jgi:cobyrinic acid a,c-diamide synthase
MPCAPSRVVPRLLVAGVSSGVGKTTVTVALALALRARGLRVAIFKCGPDYLDPTYHRRAAGRASHNLDGWMMGREAVLETFLDATLDADVALIEGVMGLFDGASPSSIEGSSAEIAHWLEAPVLLVLNAGGMARSVAALAHGFATFDPRLALAGLFCNQVGSASHLALLREACVETPVVGGMLADKTQQFPSRHLGLHAADESVSEDDLEAWSSRLLALTELDRVLAIANAAPALLDPRATTDATATSALERRACTLHDAPPRASSSPHADGARTPAASDPDAVSARAKPRGARSAPVCKIGIARDAAFSFYYPYNLRLLEQLGAELVSFSPLDDAALPDVDGVYLGGGYPELHAARLSQNHGLRAALHHFAARGRPIYAECGGLMFLSEAIVTLDQARHAMVGLIPGVAIMQPKLSALGYVEVQTRAETLLGPAGTSFRGHQFRYSRFESSEPPSRYSVRTRRTGTLHDEGYGTGSVLASYVHAHWASNQAVARNFVAACAHALAPAEAGA